MKEEIRKFYDTEIVKFMEQSIGNRKPILVGLSGSYAYGTNVDDSDIDVRGIVMNSPKEILLGTDFEQFTDENSDTTLYSMKKMCKLLSNCNPNTIELLGLLPEHYLLITDIGNEMIQNADKFLSRRAIATFGGYASQQLYRLMQASTKKMDQTELEQHILKTVRGEVSSLTEEYHLGNNASISFSVEKSRKTDMDLEIFASCDFSAYPLRDLCSLMAQLQQTVSSYNKAGRRNSRAMAHSKMPKHMEHLIRVYLMGIDILEKGVIKTYRSEDHDLLMKLRNGSFMTEDGKVRDEFYELLQTLESRFSYAKENTDLPEIPDIEWIEEFQMRTYRQEVENRG